MAHPSLIDRRAFLRTIPAALAAAKLHAAASRRTFLYIGTRADGKGQGIRVCSFDPATGKYGPLTLAVEFQLPTAFTSSADRPYLYSVSELGNDGKSDGKLAAFSIDKQSGSLTLLNQVSSGGGGPTSIILDKTGKTLLAANFGSGRTTAVRVLPGGKLGELTASINETGSGPHRRQASAHAHAVLRSPDNRFILVPDFGADKVYVFRFNAVTGALTANDPPTVSLPPGSGPRQMVFHPSGRFVYLLNELVATLTVYAWHPKEGTLSEIQSLSALATPPQGEPSGAGIAMHPNGRFLLTTTRSDNAVESFAVDEASGKLTMRDHVSAGGDQPWSCALHPTGSHLAVTNFGSNSVVILGVDGATGSLKAVGEPFSAPSPVCAAFVRV